MTTQASSAKQDLNTRLGVWMHRRNRRAYMEWLQQQLEIESPEDWYILTNPMLRRYGGRGLLESPSA